MAYKERMGDGRLIEMSKEDIRSDIEAGCNDAADRGKISALSEDAQERLLEILIAPERVASVEPEDTVVFSTDNGYHSLYGNFSEAGGVGIPIDSTTANMLMERAFGFDSVFYGWLDFSFKSSKAVITQQQQEIESILTNTLSPLIYGAMPNLGGYYKPDGPFDNVGDLMAEGKILEGMETYEKLVDHAKNDIVWVSEQVTRIGTECINIDTTASAGDGGFLSSLKACEELKKRTGLSIEMGMASEFVMGIHGGLEYEGNVLAGMYPHKQVEMAEKAGVDIFGPVVNTNTRKSTPWNIARAITFTLECSKVANIPIHPNMGMGVGGLPMAEMPPVDAVTKASRAMVELAEVDGI